MKTDITVIIPIHEINDTTKLLLNNAVKSVAQQTIRPDELLFVIPVDKPEIDAAIKDSINESLKSLTPEESLTFKVVYNTNETDFCSQMNFGVSQVSTKYFSFLEMDDEYSKIWLMNAIEYIQAYPEVDVFLPLIVDVAANGGFIGFTNEAVWANQFSDEMGMLDLQSLLTYQNFNIDGMVMNTEIYKDLGGLKSKIELTFIYEFLLRLAHKDIKIMTLPKFGYEHVNQREGSLFFKYRNTLTPDESKWWLAQAKKEYYYDYDRAITLDK